MLATGLALDIANARPRIDAVRYSVAYSTSSNIPLLSPSLPSADVVWELVTSDIGGSLRISACIRIIVLYRLQ